MVPHRIIPGADHQLVAVFYHSLVNDHYCFVHFRRYTPDLATVQQVQAHPTKPFEMIFYSLGILRTLDSNRVAQGVPFDAFLKFLRDD